MNKQSLGDRMKENYENRSKTYLTRRTPVIIRLDGKAFHTYTKGLDRPFDEGLTEDMNDTAIHLCEQIQGCKAAYIQSDEISLLLTDYDSLQTQAWFDYNIQKMCSISASMCSSKFNQLRLQRKIWSFLDESNNLSDFSNKPIKLANFDSRAFNVPKEEVNNYFIWRQRDFERNSIQMLARSLYGHSECTNKNSSQLQEMCFQKGKNWNDLNSHYKRGRLIIKRQYWDDELVQVNDVPSKNKLNYHTSKYTKINDEFFIKDKIINPISINIKNRWEVLEETPKFSKTEIINRLI